jgi:hypothetical protein
MASWSNPGSPSINPLTGAIEREWPAPKIEPSDEQRFFPCAEPRLTAFPHPDGSGQDNGVLPSDEREDEDEGNLENVHEFHSFGRLIEPPFPNGVPLASGRRQGKLRRGWHELSAQPADLQVASRALASFALRGQSETVPQTAGREGTSRKADAIAPTKEWRKENWKICGIVFRAPLCWSKPVLPSM